MNLREWIEYLKKGMEKGDIKDTCWCGNKLHAEDLEYYPHGDGWTVDGMAGKQWLYIVCRKCGYQWAIWKLGVERDNELGGEV